MDWVPINSQNNSPDSQDTEWQPINSNTVISNKTSNSPMGTGEAIDKMATMYAENVIWPDIKSTIAGAGTGFQNVAKKAVSLDPLSPVNPNNSVLNTNLYQKLNTPNNGWSSFGQTLPALAFPGGEGAGIITSMIPNALYGYAANPQHPIEGALSYAGGSLLGSALGKLGSSSSSLSESLNPVQYSKDLIGSLKDAYDTTKNSITNGTGTVRQAIRNMGQNLRSTIADKYNTASKGALNYNDGNVIQIQKPEDISTQPIQYQTAKMMYNGQVDPMSNWDKQPESFKKTLIDQGYVKPVSPPIPTVSQQIQSVIPQEIHQTLSNNPLTSDLYEDILSGTKDPSFDNFHKLSVQANTAYGKIKATDPVSWASKIQLSKAAQYIKQNLLLPHLDNASAVIKSQTGVDPKLSTEFTNADNLTRYELSNFRKSKVFPNIYNAYKNANTDEGAQEVNSEIQKGLKTSLPGTADTDTQTIISPASKLGQIAPSIQKMAAFEKSPELMKMITGKNTKYSPADVISALEKSNLDDNPDLQNAYNNLTSKIASGNQKTNKILKLGLGGLAIHGNPLTALALAGADEAPIVHAGLSNALKLSLGIGKGLGKVSNKLKLPLISRTAGTANALNNTNNQ